MADDRRGYGGIGPVRTQKPARPARLPFYTAPSSAARNPARASGRGRRSFTRVKKKRPGFAGRAAKKRFSASAFAARAVRGGAKERPAGLVLFGADLGVNGAGFPPPPFKKTGAAIRRRGGRVLSRGVSGPAGTERPEKRPSLAKKRVPRVLQARPSVFLPGISASASAFTRGPARGSRCRLEPAATGRRGPTRRPASRRPPARCGTPCPGTERPRAE